MPDKSMTRDGKKDKDPIVDRVDELAGLFVGFAFALQYVQQT